MLAEIGLLEKALTDAIQRSHKVDFKCQVDPGDFAWFIEKRGSKRWLMHRKGRFVLKKVEREGKPYIPSAFQRLLKFIAKSVTMARVELMQREISYH